ncbi:MAG: hypothetical protein ACYCW6_17305 [Candidatus Xenobia bacterium]
MEQQPETPTSAEAVPMSARQVPVLVWVALTYCMIGLLGFLVYKVLPDYFDLLDRFVATGLKLPIGLMMLEHMVRPLLVPQIAAGVWSSLLIVVLALTRVRGSRGENLQRVLVFTIAAGVLVCMVAWVQMLLALRAYVQ